MIRAKFHIEFPSATLADLALSIDTELPAKGVTALFGRSGAGKTTLLRCIAGLQHDPNGELRFGDQVWQDKHNSLPCHQRNIGYVFQEPRLFPHLDVHSNLRFSQRAAGNAKENEVLELLDIHPLLGRPVQGLSGGEQQRVAIGRALLSKPQLLLMDEPLSSLDASRKNELLPYLERIKDEAGIPILYVSHSQQEVARLADHLVVLERGRLIAAGDPVRIINEYQRSAEYADTPSTLLAAPISATDSKSQLASLAIGDQVLHLRSEHLVQGDIARVQIYAKDVSIALSEATDSSILNILPARVDAIVPNVVTGTVAVRLALADNHELISLITLKSLQRLQLTTGMQVWAQIKSVALIQ
ncbi:MAG: molybdenum ABC transporter ATP-binding protein [Pseudomonadales bacterium]